MFLDSDVFSIVTNITEKGNFDIIEFKSMYIISFFIFKKLILLNRPFNPNNNEVLFQPKLGNYPIKVLKKLQSVYRRTVFLWTKCIRTIFYQKALKRIGEERFSRFMTKREDVVANCFIFNEAYSYKFITKYGTLNLPRAKRASRKSCTPVDSLRLDLYWTHIAIETV